MIVSNEPGYYEDGAFGIRIENLLIAKQAETPFTFGGLPYVSFERLTLVPMQRKLMDLKVQPDHYSCILFKVGSQSLALISSLLISVVSLYWYESIATDAHLTCPCTNSLLSYRLRPGAELYVRIHYKCAKPENTPYTVLNFGPDGCLRISLIDIY